jgi:phytoene synthase
MEFEAGRAHHHFGRAAAVLPREDRRAMISAEIMGAIYRKLLRRMEADRFQVFARDYRVSDFGKIFCALRQLVRVV